jgi:hypothetical protein
MAEKKEKGTINLKKNGTKSEKTKLTRADFDLALETINNQLKEIEYWKEAVASARNGEEHYLNLLDQEYKKNDEIFQFVKNNIQRLKYAFKMGFDVTGSVTYADIDYNLDLLPRMLEHKFFKEEKEQD